MSETDPAVAIQARQTIKEFLARTGLSGKRRRAYLVSYPRSGNTLVREYFAILQGRPQPSIYEGDVVMSANAALTRSLDHVELIKSHQMPADGSPIIYLVRDGRNATLSFLYMAFLFGGHQFSRLAEVYDGLRHLDEAEGRWADHVAQALAQAQTRQIQVVRYEDMICSPQAELARMARFMGVELSAEMLDECVRRQTAFSSYAKNPHNGYLYEPAKGSIYDILKGHRREDYWRHIFDARSKQYFHDRGGTRWLLHFGYERSADWWKE
jgi:hypothetical protein